MKEFKFRAWCGDKFRNDVRLDFQTGKLYDSGEYKDYERNYLIEQYTGLKDKNDKEIYEGDIIRAFDSKGEDIKQIIVWDKENARFGCKLALYPSQGGVRQPWIDEFKYELIGNIHENPELLK